MNSEQEMVGGIIEAGIRENIRVKEKLLSQTALISEMVQILYDCIRGGGKVIFFGNGGSAADAQHLAAELAGRLYLDRPSLPAVSLSTNSSALTAVGNDYGFDHVFSRQLPGIGNRGDVAVAISTSGKSPNVLEAVRLAKRIGMITFAWTGRDGGELAKLADYVLHIDSDESPRIQEAHILAGHIICQIVERRLFG
ncbi:MAG: D-sedoheptulose 7-phosphate isomerase [Candidatus Eisenbacteria bacterium]|nr:D-sedoheptulose 7-phosphate isomerase [Candidatus Eisenbacteria bacterium]